MNPYRFNRIASVALLVVGLVTGAAAEKCGRDGRSRQDHPCKVTASENGNALSYLALTAACCAGAFAMWRRKRTET